MHKKKESKVKKRNDALSEGAISVNSFVYNFIIIDRSVTGPVDSLEFSGIEGVILLCHRGRSVLHRHSDRRFYSDPGGGC